MSETKAEAATAVPSVPDAFPLGLDEFCVRLSSRVRRPELIGGFYAHAKSTGMLSAQEPEFMAAFEAYRRLPA